MNHQKFISHTLIYGIIISFINFTNGKWGLSFSSFLLKLAGAMYFKLHSPDMINGSAPKTNLLSNGFVNLNNSC